MSQNIIFAKNQKKISIHKRLLKKLLKRTEQKCYILNRKTLL